MISYTQWLPTDMHSHRNTNADTHANAQIVKDINKISNQGLGQNWKPQTAQRLEHSYIKLPTAVQTNQQKLFHRSRVQMPSSIRRSKMDENGMGNHRSSVVIVHNRSMEKYMRQYQYEVSSSSTMAFYLRISLSSRWFYFII